VNGTLYIFYYHNGCCCCFLNIVKKHFNRKRNCTCKFFEFNLGICTVVKRHQMLGHVALYKYSIIIIIIVIIIILIIKICLFLWSEGTQ